MQTWVSCYFDDDGSDIQHKQSGEKIQLYERNNTYVFPIYVVPKHIAHKLQYNKNPKPLMPFQRQVKAP